MMKIGRPSCRICKELRGWNHKANRAITREEASKIIAMVAGLDEQLEGIELDFVDSNEIGDWAKDYVKAMKYQGYMQGYQDGTFRPKKQITRAETAKILADISRSIKDDPIEEPDVKDYLVQIGSYSSLESANEEAWKLVLAGFEDTFIIKDDKYYVMAGKFSTEEDAQIFKTIVSSRGFEAFITTRDFEEGSLIRATEPIKEIPRYEEFIKLADELPNPRIYGNEWLQIRLKLKTKESIR